MQNLALDFEIEDIVTGIVSDIDLWKEQLEGSLNGFTKAVNEYEKAERDLESFIRLSNSSVNAMSSIEELVNKWIDEKCTEATCNATNISHLKISRDRLPSEIGSFSFPRCRVFHNPDPEIKKGKSIFDASTEELVTYALNIINFDGLSAALAEESRVIESDGFKAAANELGSKFNLSFRHAHNKSQLQVKQQKARLILEVSHYGSWAYDRINSLTSVLAIAKTFELEAGVYGLRDCILAAIAEERKVERSDYSIPSRTKVNEGENVEGVFFNEKIKFHFKPEIFEALIGFVQNYTDHTMKSIEVK